MEIKEHPLSKFKYYPKCWSERFEIITWKEKKCEECIFKYSYKVSGGVAVIINKR